jgi:S-adenosyl-L-methionine hydrolase (adenosine-forming)
MSVIALFTDFGVAGPYAGQVKAVLARRAPAVPVVDLFADAPAFDPRLSAYLLAAYAEAFEPGDVVLAVIDPGVGSTRRALVLEADGRRFVGPDNGLFELVLRRAGAWRCWMIESGPEPLSATFHGRDLFAPAAARLALGEPPSGPSTFPMRFADWPDDLPEIVYVDHYGNAITGLRASLLAADAELEVAGWRIPRGRTFSDVPPGTPLWYENSNQLAEIALNGGNAASALSLAPGRRVRVV